MTKPLKGAALASDIEGVICDWNAPYRLAVSMKATCERLARYCEKYATSHQDALLAELEEGIESLDNPYPSHKGSVVKDWQPINHAYEVGKNKALDKIKEMRRRLK